jgi:hypothetical protein
VNSVSPPLPFQPLSAMSSSSFSPGFVLFVGPGV